MGPEISYSVEKDTFKSKKCFQTRDLLIKIPSLRAKKRQTHKKIVTRAHESALSIGAGERSNPQIRQYINSSWESTGTIALKCIWRGKQMHRIVLPPSATHLDPSFLKFCEQFIPKFLQWSYIQKLTGNKR